VGEIPPPCRIRSSRQVPDSLSTMAVTTVVFIAEAAAQAAHYVILAAAPNVEGAVVRMRPVARIEPRA